MPERSDPDDVGLTLDPARIDDSPSRIQVKGMRFSHFPVGNETLVGARFEDCRFLKMKFSAANMNNVELLGCTIVETAMNFVALGLATIRRSTFTRCNLVEVGFHRATVEDTRFESTQMTLGRFVNSTFREVDGRGCWMNRALFREATFEDCDFRGVDLRDGRFEGATFVRCDLRGAKISPKPGSQPRWRFEECQSDGPLPPAVGDP
ncbi:pentapeptide repeat-containing protein [Polyangium jinanense]|uniref:Pentapeptide repeat-containing protein n=1 Tax=Polyangium jinanense TaxID=2829994 RepID=A0A9X4AV17_9BACT|nr:pentapeptide repeat-containing protein [Polyangium jinanense]MDC3959962.1 pentapeptide repeat-containing protein [Polyangium jinanense]MDC3983842.1 pentapeptide repeat-containing protein [Polyangium jinanense]